MDDITILEEFGLQEVSRKTHIEIKYLKYMLEKKFDKLNRINTLGFVKILRREYNLDLSQWVEEFEEYNQANKKEDSNKDNRVLQQDIAPKKSKSKVLLLLFALILIGIGFWYFNGMQYINQLKDRFAEENSSTFTTAAVVEETIEKLDALEEKGETSAKIVETLPQNNIIEENITDTKTEDTAIPEEENIEVNNTPLITNETKQEIINDNNKEEAEEKQEIPTTPQNTSISIEEENINVHNVQEEKIAKPTPSLPTQIIIKPNKKIWIGAVNLVNKTRKTRLRSTDIALDITEPQLLVVGHGDFVFDLGDGNIQKSSSKLKSYYHIENGKVQPITKKEFMKLNGGKSW